MYYLIKWIGLGIHTQGIWFKPDGDTKGLYVVDKCVKNYLSKNFSKRFIMIEKVKQLDDLTYNEKYIERGLNGDCR